MATVLRFDHEVLMSGRSLPRPINYALSRIVPPPGVATDPDGHANNSNGPRISTADSRVSVWVIPTDEELMIAQHTLAVVRPSLN